MPFPPFSNVFLDEPQDSPITLKGGYFPGMPQADFDNAFYEVADPLHLWASENWLGNHLNSDGLTQLSIHIQSWFETNVPRAIRHPIVGATVEGSPNDPHAVTINLTVDSLYIRYMDELAPRTLPRVESLGGPVPRPNPASVRVGLGLGWDDDPLEF